jgi:putative flippase GtrA
MPSEAPQGPFAQAVLTSWLGRWLHLFVGNPRQLMKYISAGGIAATVELLLFTLFHQYFVWPLLVANSCALAVAIVTSFALQRSWTFRAQGGASRQFRLYLLMQGISALFNTGLIYLFVARWGWLPPLAKVVQIGIVFVWNFSFCKLVIFSDREPESST